MLTPCPGTDDRRVLLGQSLGIGLAVGLVCGGILVFIFFIVYRSDYIQNLAAIKRDSKFTGKNRSEVTSHTSGEPQEAQRYQTRTEVMRDKKRQRENIGVRYKNQQKEEEIINVSQTDNQNTDSSLYENYNNYAQPTCETLAEVSNYENEYDYVAPTALQGWHYDKAQSSEGYVDMKPPQHTQWYNDGQK